MVTISSSLGRISVRLIPNRIFSVCYSGISGSFGIAKIQNRNNGLTKLALYATEAYQKCTIFLCLLNTKFLCQVRTAQKSRSLQGLLESTKKNGGGHVFFRNN